jgi:hypothetical protein
MIAKGFAPEIGAKPFAIMVGAAAHTTGGVLMWRACRMGNLRRVGSASDGMHTWAGCVRVQGCPET